MDLKHSALNVLRDTAGVVFFNQNECLPPIIIPNTLTDSIKDAQL